MSPISIKIQSDENVKLKTKYDKLDETSSSSEEESEEEEEEEAEEEALDEERANTIKKEENDDQEAAANRNLNGSSAYDLIKRELNEIKNQAINQDDFKRSNDVSMDLGLFNFSS